MGEVASLFVLLAGSAGVALARVLRRRERCDAVTREWIAFLQEDLASTL